MARKLSAQFPLCREGQSVHHPHEETEGSGNVDRKVLSRRGTTRFKARANSVSAATALERKYGETLKLPSGTSEQHRYVMEFRDESWMVQQVFEVLRAHNAAFCIHDLAAQQTPLEITADFTYVRFHGPGAAKYRGSYSDAVLRKWADRIAEWQDRLAAVYVYFNNDIGGAALENAALLKQLLQT